MKNFSKAKYISYLSIMLTLIVVLSFLESMLPPTPFLPPGVKLGLSNIVKMFVLLFMGKKEAFSLTIAKSVFVFLTRGFTSGVLSLSGGFLSILVIILLSTAFKQKISYLLLSVFGAIFHNIGQLIAVTLILDNLYTLYFLPVLIVSGVFMGTITGVLLKQLLPILKYPIKELKKWKNFYSLLLF